MCGKSKIQVPTVFFGRQAKRSQCRAKSRPQALGRLSRLRRAAGKWRRSSGVCKKIAERGRICWRCQRDSGQARIALRKEPRLKAGGDSSIMAGSKATSGLSWESAQRTEPAPQKSMTTRARRYGCPGVTAEHEGGQLGGVGWFRIAWNERQRTLACQWGHHHTSLSHNFVLLKIR